MQEELRLIKTSNPQFFREESSSAIINNDVSAYEAYKDKRTQQQQMQSLSHEVASLKDELGEMKDILLRILNGRNDGI